MIDYYFSQPKLKKKKKKDLISSIIIDIYI